MEINSKNARKSLHNLKINVKNRIVVLEKRILNHSNILEDLSGHPSYDLSNLLQKQKNVLEQIEYKLKELDEMDLIKTNII